jgi:soluble lytic murein transglycosylase
MRQIPGFELTQRFYALGLFFEGSREWNWALRGMNDRQLLAAAEFANQLSLYDRAINTANRTRGIHNFSLRYLTPFRDSVERYANLAQLDMSWVYGLIRQESRFLVNVHSNVGAIGLMQIMPRTAQRVAQAMGLENFSTDQLCQAPTNIFLGTSYLAMVYARFHSLAVLASASYNAGPHRVQQWQATLTRPIEGAIFTENIPFDETREYVKNVLSNALYYSISSTDHPQPLKTWLGYISPTAQDT